MQPLANPVDTVLTAFDWISAYYTVLASQLEAVCSFSRVVSNAVLRLSVSNMEEFSVQVTTVPSNTKEQVGE